MNSGSKDETSIFRSDISEFAACSAKDETSEVQSRTSKMAEEMMEALGTWTKNYKPILVGGLEHGFCFSIDWEWTNPNWLVISEGVKPTISNYCRLQIACWLQRILSFSLVFYLPPAQQMPGFIPGYPRCTKILTVEVVWIGKWSWVFGIFIF